MSDYRFSPRDVIQSITEWPMVESFVKEALDQDKHTLLTPDDIRHQLRSNRMKLWMIYDDVRLIGAFVTEIVSGSRGKAVNIICLSGSNMNDWIADFSHEMSRYAVAHHCRYVCEMGRAGWTRILSKLGWVDASSVMLKMVA